MPSTTTFCGCDMSSVYDEGASTRSQRLNQTPTSPGIARCEGKQIHEQLSQGEAIQYVNLQDPLHTRLPGRDPEIRDNRLVQYTDSRLCLPFNWTYSSDCYRVSSPIAFPRCGIGHPTGIAALSARSPTKRAALGSIRPWSKT